MERGNFAPNTAPNTQEDYENDFEDPREALDTDMPNESQADQKIPDQAPTSEPSSANDTFVLSQKTQQGDTEFNGDNQNTSTEGAQRSEPTKVTWWTLEESGIVPPRQNVDTPVATEKNDISSEEQKTKIFEPPLKQNKEAEQGSNPPSQEEKVAENFVDINQFAAERQPGNPESQEGQESEKRKEREKTRAEKRLDDVRQRLERIESSLKQANDDNARLEEEINRCESALENNIEAHGQLSDKVNQLRDKVNKTKRNIISGFTDGLRIVKGLVLGRHQEVRNIVDNISKNVNENEQATQERDKAEQELMANEAEKFQLENTRADAIDIQTTNNKKIANLEKWRADLRKQEARLQEKVDEEARAKAWEDAREAIKVEMGTDNMKEFRKDLARQKQELEESLQADLDELDMFRHPSRIQRLMRTEAELRAEAAKADEVETKLRAEYDKKVSEINEKLAKVEEYFPTWRERVARSRSKPATKRGLAFVKRKALSNNYDVAA